MITFVGSSNVSNGIAQGTSAVVPKPGGVIDGDLLLAFVSIGHTGTITAPAGWTEVSLGTNTAPNLQNRIYWKYASVEPASWTWTFTSAAYVGICHATRGVGGIYAAQQSDDGLSLLSHTTPTLGAPADAWIISSWTGRNLLALGWSPPAGDTERQDVIGGLLILLNVNHAVDDTGGPVAAGNYSKTAATLVAVRALNALVVLAPVLDPILLESIGSPVGFGTLETVLNVSGDAELFSPEGFGGQVLELGVDLSGPPAPIVFGAFELVQQILADPEVGSEVSYGLLDVGHELVLSELFGSPVAVGSLMLEQSITVDSLASPALFNLTAVLPEQELMITSPLSVPVIAGSGGITGVLMTFQQQLDEPFITLGTRFGTPVVFQVFEPACCTVA